MSALNRELLTDITDQFKAQIAPGILRKMHVTSGYFNTGLPLQYKHKIKTNDVGFLGRIFDSVKLDARSTEAFYDAVMQSKDPVQELLVPLLGSISERIFAADAPELRPSIRNDFKEYDEVRRKYSDEAFKTIMLRAVISACSAMLVDFQAKKTQSLLSSDPDKAQQLNIVFSSKITIPFDAYSINLNLEKFKSDLDVCQKNSLIVLHKKRNWFIKLVLRAFASLTYQFRAHAKEHEKSTSEEVEMTQKIKESPVEQKILILLSGADQALELIKPLCEEDKSCQALLKEMYTFRENLFGLKTEIDELREMGMAFEIKANLGLDGLSRGFEERINKLVDIKPEDLSVGDEAVVTSLVNGFISTHLNPNLGQSAGSDLTNEEDQSRPEL